MTLIFQKVPILLFTFQIGYLISISHPRRTLTSLPFTRNINSAYEYYNVSKLRDTVPCFRYFTKSKSIDLDSKADWKLFQLVSNNILLGKGNSIEKKS